MKRDPFASLGLDQQLFSSAPLTAMQRNNETTLARDNGATSARSLEATNTGANERLKRRTAEPTRSQTNEATKIQASDSPRHRPVSRQQERHSHDIYYDQVRWMNRTKVEVEERYGERVTSNGIVQVALDLLRLEFEARGPSSNLVQVLVNGDEPRLRGEEGDR